MSGFPRPRGSAPADASSYRLTVARRLANEPGVTGEARGEGTRPGSTTGTRITHKACGHVLTPGLSAGHHHEIACAQRAALARRFPNHLAPTDRGAAGERRAGATGTTDRTTPPGGSPGPDR